MKKQIKQNLSYHLIKSEDLNHHGTLYFGRALEWFAESAFVSVAQMLPPNELVGYKIDTLIFKKSAKLGDIICYNSRVINVGKSSLTVYVKVNGKDDYDQCSNILVDGFATFVHVDENTKSKNHNIQLEITCDEDLLLIEKYNLRKK